MEQCRFCGVQKYMESMFSLFDSELMIEAKLEKVFSSFQLYKDKLLPNSVCSDCYTKLENAADFLTLIEETQESLMDSVNQQLIRCDNSLMFAEDIKMEILQASVAVDQSATTSFLFVDDKPPNKKAKHRKTPTSSKEVTSSYNRWKGANPVYKVEEIFVQELECGVFETEPETLAMSDSEKNPDGTLSEEGKYKVLQSAWISYNWKCVECNLFVESSKELEDHFKRDHKNLKVTYPCMDCKQSFKSYFSFQNHVIDVHKPHLKFCCDVCSDFRWNLTELYKHRQQFHPKFRNTCLYCGRLFDCGFNLKQHVSVHLKFEEDQLFHCDICGYKSHTKFLIKQHFIASHIKNSTELVCEQCGKICKRLSDMKSHQLVHSTERPYGCELCDLRFKCKKQLRSHKKTHFPRVLPEECIVCKKRFLTKGKLTRHSRIHSEDFAYTCEFCGRKFKHASGFNTHRRIHTGSRPYSCTFVGCDQKFIDWPNMNKHCKNKHGIDNSTRKKKIYLNEVSQDP